MKIIFHIFFSLCIRCAVNPTKNKRYMAPMAFLRILDAYLFSVIPKLWFPIERQIAMEKSNFPIIEAYNTQTHSAHNHLENLLETTEMKQHESDGHCTTKKN